MPAQMRERTLNTTHPHAVAEVMTALGIPATVNESGAVAYTSDGYGGRAAAVADTACRLRDAGVVEAVAAWLRPLDHEQGVDVLEHTTRSMLELSTYRVNAYTVRVGGATLRVDVRGK